MNTHVATTSDERPAPDHKGMDPRVEAILLQARHAFVEKGFDGASMQDLARAAGMSAGNFYRYFPSKAAIVEALVNRDIVEMESEFAGVIGSPQPLNALRDVIRKRLTEDCEKDLPLWAEIMAAAARKPEIAVACARMENSIIHKTIAVMSLGSGIDEETGKERYFTLAQFILLLVRCASMQGSTGQPVNPALNDLIMKTIDTLFNDITTMSPETTK